MLRDKSNLAVGLLLPFVLILLFGYGLSFDVKDAPVAVVLQDNSQAAEEFVMGLQGSDYIQPLWLHSIQDAEMRLRQGDIEGIVHIPADFSTRLLSQDAQIFVAVNGANSTMASAIQTYVSGAIAGFAVKQTDRQGIASSSNPGVQIVQRMWFNETVNSTWYLVPGLIVLVMTLIGAFLTSLLIAREWERGTLESLFVTPVRPLELVLAKLIPYIVIGLVDLLMCLLAARWLFEVPLRGSMWIVLTASFLYLTVSLLLGLFISGKTKNQFQASQLALVASFMPALMLSGFVFDLRNTPVVIQFISQILPATHFMGLIKTLFLVGDNWQLIIRECVILLVFILGLGFFTCRTLRKRLE